MTAPFIMKPRLTSVPLTDQDRLILLNWCCRDPLSVHCICNYYIDSDSRDADLMHTRTHRQAFFCKVCWDNIAHDACTVDHEIRLRRPFHPDSLGALLRDALK